MWKLELPCKFYFQRRLKVKSRSVLVSTRPDFPSRLNSLNLLPLICRVNQKTPGQGPLCPPTINFMAIFISSRREVSSISGGGDARTAHSESETQKPQNQVCSYNRFLQKKEAGHSCGMKAETRASRRASGFTAGFWEDATTNTDEMFDWRRGPRLWFTGEELRRAALWAERLQRGQRCGRDLPGSVPDSVQNHSI